MARGSKARQQAVTVKFPLGMSSEISSDASSDARSDESQGDSADEIEAAEAIAEVQSETGRGAQSTVFRMDEETGRAKWCATVPTSTLSNAYIAKRFGPGRFKVMHRKPKKGGGYIGAGSQTFDIDESAAEYEPSAAGHAIEPASSPIGDAVNASFLGMMSEMLKASQVSNAMILQTFSATREKPTTPKWMEALLGVLGASLPVLLEKLLLKGDDKSLTLALKLAEILKPAGGGEGGGGLMQRLEEMEVLQSVAERISVRGGNDETLAVVNKGLDMFSRLAAPNGGNAGNAGNGAPAQNGHAPVSAAPATRVLSRPAPPQPVRPALAPAPDLSHVRLWLRPLVPEVAKAGQYMGYSPLTVAGFLWDRLVAPDETVLADLRADLADDSSPFVERTLAVLNPPPGDVTAWTRDIVEQLGEWGSETDDDDEMPPNDSPHEPEESHAAQA